MKILFPVVILFIFKLSSCFAQDLITKKTGEDIHARILEIGPKEYKYADLDTPDSTVKTILKTEVLMVRYQNGTKDIYIDNKKIDDISNPNYSIEFYKRGQEDATRCYRGYSGAATTTVITTIIFIPLGLVSAIATSSAKPKDLNVPDLNLIKRKDYHDGYVQIAKKIKKQKVWRSFGITLGVEAFFYAMMVYSLNQ